VVRCEVLAVIFLVAFVAPGVRGQDTEEVKRLKERVAALEARLKRAEAENAQLKAEAAQLKAAAAKDGFVKGAVFDGRRESGGKVTHALKLEVTSRQGTSFTGVLSLSSTAGGGVRTVKVNGTAPVGNGKASFSTEKVGTFQLRFTGAFNNGELDFDFAGSNDKGDRVSGKGKLTAK
jgi:hypothetical protein